MAPVRALCTGWCLCNAAWMEPCLARSMGLGRMGSRRAGAMGTGWRWRQMARMELRLAMDTGGESIAEALRRGGIRGGGDESGGVESAHGRWQAVDHHRHLPLRRNIHALEGWLRRPARAASQ